MDFSKSAGRDCQRIAHGRTDRIAVSRPEAAARSAGAIPYCPTDSTACVAVFDIIDNLTSLTNCGNLSLSRVASRPITEPAIPYCHGSMCSRSKNSPSDRVSRMTPAAPPLLPFRNGIRCQWSAELDDNIPTSCAGRMGSYSCRLGSVCAFSLQVPPESRWPATRCVTTRSGTFNGPDRAAQALTPAKRETQSRIRTMPVSGAGLSA